VIRSLAALAVAIGVLTSAPAEADDDWQWVEDHRPCVSYTEFYTFDLDLRKGQFNRLVETRGTLVEPGLWRTYVYKACGYSLDESWIEVTFNMRTRHIVLAQQYIYGDATLHGQARTR
jgi:hypothetical protein